FTTSKFALIDPPPPALVKYWLVLGFQILKVRSIPATSTWARELGSNAILAMISGCTFGVTRVLEALSNCVPASAVSAVGRTTNGAPLELPMYWLGFSNETPIVTFSSGWYRNRTPGCRVQVKPAM